MAFQNSLFAILGLPGGYSSVSTTPTAGDSAKSLIVDTRRIGWSYEDQVALSRHARRRYSSQTGRSRRR